MNICKSDIYFIVLLVLLLILFYKIYKLENIKEGFDATSDMKAVINQVYNADIEAIRNLSSIATQLTTGGLTIPGKLNLPNNTSLSADGDDATHWLRLQQTNNPGQYKSFAAQDLWCAQGTLSSGTISNSGNATVGGTLTSGALNNSGNATIGGTLNVGGITNVNALNTGGGTNNNPGGKDAPWGTHFPWKGDGNNYIRGNTILNGNLVVSGTITIGNPGSGGEYTLMPGGDGFRIASGGENDGQRWWFKRNPGQRNV